MSSVPSTYTADEFEQESYYLESLIWEAMVVEPESKVLVCGFGPEGAQVRRAMATGAKVTVIEHRERAIAQFANLGARLLRGSTSVIPAKENPFDLAISFHYLHEIDPFFHAQVLSELARVARRVAVVEPAPPGDPLGKRIALLYSQAKRELGQFEYYQPLEYWKKLLQAVKADVSQHVFAFGKVPPREYLLDTIELLLSTMEVEDAPASYIEELRQIARKSDSQILPPPRYVLVGAAVGELSVPHFSLRTPPPVKAAPKPPAPAVQAPAPRVPAPAAQGASPVSADEGYEFPPVEAPARRAVSPVASSAPSAPPAPAGPTGFGKPVSEPPPPFVPGLPFGAPSPPPPPPTGPAQPTAPPGNPPFGAPFAVAPADAFGVPPPGIPPSTTWQWEPPEGGDDETPFGSPGKP